MSTPSAKPETSEPQEETRLQTIASLCSNIIFFLFAVTFICQNFFIPSGSMASTLLVGDHVVVDRASLAPPASFARILPYRSLQRDEPVVFYKPVTEPDGSEAILVKRVVGLPGDRIHLRGGILYRNGVARNEPQTAKPTFSNYDPYRDDFPSVAPTNVHNVTAQWALDLPNHIQGEDLVVPPDTYFVMGDNRTNSLDGRFWGFVPRANLIGRPLFVYWSFDTPEDQKTTLTEQASFALHQVTHFFTDTRWSRTFHPIH